jgi:hypothetical protein
MPGLQQPVDLYAVRSPRGDAPLSQAWQQYDSALQQFEQGLLSEAAFALAQIEPAITNVPWRFLSQRVQSELGRQKRRRSSDKPVAFPGGVIALSAK